MKCSITGIPSEFCTCAAHVTKAVVLDEETVKHGALTLREARCTFTHNIAALIRVAVGKGYEVALDCVKVPEGSPDGRSSASLHRIGLAADINLYRAGNYLRLSEDHKELGTFWKQLHPLNRWGGDFKDKQGNSKPDGNHYSMEWMGCK